MPGRSAVAARLAGLVQSILGAELPVRLRAWDGSEAGPLGAPVLIVHSRRALRRLLWDPGELGLVRAYVAGEIDVEGDLVEGLRRCWRLARRQQIDGFRLSAADRLAALRTAVQLAAVGPRPEPPPEEARLSGTRHTRRRDRDAIAHHYDLSTTFLERVLDPHMAYSCAYWTSDDPGYTIEDAQRDKLDLVCAKLDLGPSMRLLDVGCGWGSLLIHAARTYGVAATGVTLSAQQRDYIQGRIAEHGLQGSVEVRLQDYRDIDDDPYDAVAGIEVGEHIGEENYPAFAAALHGLLRPQGRLVLQQMSRGSGAPGGSGGGPFIESYIAPDMDMRPLSRTMGMLEQAGLEIRDVQALREHYVRTARAWAAGVEARWNDLVALAGESQARMWWLYMTAGSLTFEENRMGVDQILAVRTTEDGHSGMPAVGYGHASSASSASSASALPALPAPPALASHAPAGEPAHGTG